jgi:hypothetical protein
MEAKVFLRLLDLEKEERVLIRPNNMDKSCIGIIVCITGATSLMVATL